MPYYCNFKQDADIQFQVRISSVHVNSKESFNNDFIFV